MAIQQREPRPPGTPRGRRRAEALVDREYATSHDAVIRSVRSRLRATGVRLDDADLDAAYNQAWHALYAMVERGEPVDSRLGLLTTVTYRRAIDDYRAMHVDRHAALPESAAAVGPDMEAVLDDRRRLRSLQEGMRLRLTARELQAAVLCYIHGYTRPEAAKALELTPRRMEKVMDRVSKRVAEIVRDVEDGWCESQDSLIRAYALGLLDPDGDRHLLAREHVAHCTACRRRVLGLRGLAAVVPPVPLALGGAGGLAGAGQGDPATPSGRRQDSATTGAAAGAVAAAGAAAEVGPSTPRPRRPRSRSARWAAAATAAVAIAVVVAIAAAALTGGDDEPSDGAQNAAGAPSAPRTAAPSAAAGAGRPATPDAQRGALPSAADARRAARRKRRERLARRAARARRATEARRAAAATPPAAPSPAAPIRTASPARAATAPATPTAPRPSPDSPPATSPAPEEQRVVDDGAEEFDLR